MSHSITPGDEHLEENIGRLMSATEPRLAMPESSKARVLSALLRSADTSQPLANTQATPDLTTNTQAPTQAAVRLVPDVPIELADGVQRETRSMEQPSSRRHVRRRFVAMFQSKRVRWSVAAAVAAAVVLAVGFWPGKGGRGSGIAFAQVLENIRVFRPYSCLYTWEYEGQPPYSYREMRTSLARRREVWPDGRILVFDLSQQPNKVLTLNPDGKSAVEQTLLNTGPREDPDMLRIVAGMRDGSAESLGYEDVEGRPAQRFHRPDKVNDLTVWADMRTGLPIRIELVQAAVSRRLVLSEFAFDVSFDESLFSTAAPSGYTVRKVEVNGTSSSGQSTAFRPYSCLCTWQHQGKPSQSYREMHLSLSRRREVLSDGKIRVFDLSRRPIRILELRPEQKSAIEEAVPNVGPASDPDILGMVTALRDGTAEDLGEDVMDGRAVHGYHKRDPVNDITAWIDAQTSLPIRVELVQPTLSRRLVMTEFDFFSRLDESLFNTTAPEGYAVERKGAQPAGD